MGGVVLGDSKHRRFAPLGLTLLIGVVLSLVPAAALASNAKIQGSKLVVDGDGGTNDNNLDVTRSVNDAGTPIFLVTESGINSGDGDDPTLTATGPCVDPDGGMDTAECPVTGISQIEVSGLGGDDTVDVDANANTNTVDGGPGEDDLTIDSGTVNTLKGGTDDDRLFGSPGPDTLNGGGENDDLYGDLGQDTLIGGGGTNDTVGYADGRSQGVHVTLDGVNNDGYPGENDIIDSTVEGVTGSRNDDIIEGNDGDNPTLWGSDGIDQIRGLGGNDGLHGDLGDDTLDGGAGSDTLVGDAGDDMLTGGLGADYLSGGYLGSDTMRYDDGRTQGVTVTLDGVNDDGAPGEGDNSDEVENVIGTAAVDTITGDGNDNVIEGGGANDVLDGAGGSDAISYKNAPSAVNVNLATNSASGGGGSDSLTNIENVIGSAFVDTITGDDNDNVIEGGGSNDVLSGAGGGDSISYAGAPSAVNVNLATFLASGGGGLETFSGFENVIGSAFIDTLTGDANDNTIEGGGANDILDGAGGSDATSYRGAPAAVNVNLATNSVSGGADFDSITNFESATGSAFADTLTGDGNNNTLQGGPGVDLLDGAGGSDTASYADARVAEFSIYSYAGIAVDLTSGAVYDAIGNGDYPTTDAGHDTIANFENVIGTSLDDHLVGDTGPNTLRGGDGSDWLEGGAGNDTLDGQRDSDGTLNGGAGNDTINGGDGGDGLIGGYGNDTLNGGDGPDYFDGGPEDDTLNAVDQTGDPQLFCGIGTGDTANLDLLPLDSTASVDCETINRGGTPPAPDTSITSGPAQDSTINEDMPTFEFESPDGTATFECRIDAVPYGACSGIGTHTTASLNDGSHDFYVRAVNSSGSDSTPATRHFTVDTTAPETTIDSSPPGPTDTTPSFSFHSSESGSSFECNLHLTSEAGSWSSCSSPYAPADPPSDPLPDGNYKFEVRATDPAGNTETDYPSQLFTINTTNPITTLLLTGKGSATLKDKPTDHTKRSLNISIKGAVDGADALAQGASLQVTSPGHFTGTPYDLPQNLAQSSWVRLGTSTTYRYKDKDQLNGPITQAVVGASYGLKLKAKGSLLDYTLTGDPTPVSIVLQIGTTRYCASFGTDPKFKPELLFKAKTSPITSCPV